MNITWQPYERVYWSAPFKNYRIYYQAKTNTTSYDFKDGSYSFVNTNNTEYTLKDLEAFTEYSVYVTTLNEIGVGEGSHFILRTLEHGKFFVTTVSLCGGV